MITFEYYNILNIYFDIWYLSIFYVYIFINFMIKKNTKMCEALDTNFDILVYMKKSSHFYVKTMYTVYLLEVQL